MVETNGETGTGFNFVAAAKEGLIGGGNQVYIEYVDEAWIVNQ